MSRTALRPIVAALIGILLVGVAGATITAPMDTSSPNFDPGSEVSDSGKFWDFELGGGGNLFEPSDVPGERPQLFKGTCVPFLLTPYFYVIAGLTFAGLFLYVGRRMSAQFGAVAVMIVLPWVLIGHSWFTNCEDPDPQGAPFGFEYIANDTDTVSRVIESAGRDSPIPPVLVGGLLLLAVVILPLVAVFGLRGHRTEDDETPDVDATEEPLSGVGRVAGRAADRIEGSAVDVDNEVFRAWKRMTDFVDVPDPKSSTPAEFARAAREAGMDEADVDSLTDLFRTIRYGGEEPTPEREQRAVEALRAIEDAYGEGEEE
ncbi:MAG: DUF4129 domain-containing protein [archaeon]